MFARITTSQKKNATYKYLVISESIRKNGKSTIQDIAHLGNIAQFEKHDIEAIVDGLIKIFQLEKYAISDDVEIMESLEYGGIVFWRKLWKDLRLAEIIRDQLDLCHQSVQIAVEKYIEMMAVSRCIEPASKLGLTRWLETTCYKEMKGYTPDDLSYHVNYFYRSMDYLLNMKDALELSIYHHLRNLYSVNVKLTFYDITSTFFYTENCSLAEHGYSRDHRPDCEQIVIGVVTSYEGYPIKHFVFEGNTADNTTVEEVVSALKKDYNINETIFVGDRGMIAKLNMKCIEDKGYDYIMGVKMRNNELCQMLFSRAAIDWTAAEVVHYRQLKILERRVDVKGFLVWKSRDLLKKHDPHADVEIPGEYGEWVMRLTNQAEPDYRGLRGLLKGLPPEFKMDPQISERIVTLIKRYANHYEDHYRFIVCLNPERREASRKKRTAEIETFSKALDELFCKADKPGQGEKIELENLLERETAINQIFKDYKSKFRKFFDLDRHPDTKLITGYVLNRNKITAEEQFDGIFTLLSNRDDLDIEKMADSYKNLQEVEMLFDDLKNFVDIRPIRHRLEKRVRSHVFICILSLLLKRIFEINYLGGKAVTAPLEEINKAKLIKYKIKFSEREERFKVIPKITILTPDQKKYFDMIGLKNPSSLEPFVW